MNDEKNEYGVDATKRGIDYLGLSGRTLIGIDRDRNGNIENDETLGAASALLPGLFGFVGGISDVRKETKKGEFTKEEQEEVIEYIINTDFLPSDREGAEEVLDDTLLMLNYNRRYFARMLGRYRDAQEAKDLA